MFFSLTDVIICMTLDPYVFCQCVWFLWLMRHIVGVDLGNALNFMIVCLNPLPYGDEGESTGAWTTPYIQTDATGPKCAKEDSPDMWYFESVYAMLSNYPDHFQMDHLFFSGCSGGSAAGLWFAVCADQKWPGQALGFATHSTGLKMKDDGIEFISTPLYGDVPWAECDQCQYYPVVPMPSSMKGCIFDNYEDPSEEDPKYYQTSVQLEEFWLGLGNYAESQYDHGGHCHVHSMVELAICMDDGKGILIPGGYNSTGADFPTGVPPTGQESTEPCTTTGACSDDPPEGFVYV